MFLLLVLIITIPAFISLLNPWYFSMHDFQHVARLFLLDTGIHQGTLFPRWVDMLGFNFGYPLFNFYPPLIYYIAEIARLMGASYTWAIKAMVIAGYLVGAVGVYLLGRTLFMKRVSAVVASVLFTFFTYHATLVFVRGAFAEFWGMNLLPYAFLSLEHLRERKSAQSAAWFGLVFALIVLSHVFVAFPFIIFCGTYILLTLPWEKSKIRYLVSMMVGGSLGLGLSAFFWLPSMLERSFTLVDTILTRELASYTIHFVQPMQLWFSPWGYGGSGAGYADGMSFQLGKLHILAALGSFLVFSFGLLRKKITQPTVIRYGSYVVLLCVSLFLTTEYSRPVWDAIPQLQYLQFPWRMLSFTGLFIAIVGAYALDMLFSSEVVRPRALVQFALATVIVAAVVFQYGKYFKPLGYLMVKDSSLTSFAEITWRVSRSSFEFSPHGVPLTMSPYGTSILDIDQIDIPTLPFQTQQNSVVVNVVKNHFNHKAFEVTAPEESLFQLNTFYFPGWVAVLDGTPIKINSMNRYNLIRVQIPTGSHLLEFRFEDTPVRRAANGASGLTVFVVLSLLGIGQLKKRKA